MKSILLSILILAGFAGSGLAQTLTVTAGDDIYMCVGDTISLTATVSGGNPPYTYAWEPSTDVDCPTCQNVEVNPVNTTPFIVTVTDNNSNTASDTIVVTPVVLDSVLTFGNSVITGGWVDSTNNLQLIVEFDITDTFPSGADWVIVYGSDTIFLNGATTFRDTLSVADTSNGVVCPVSPDTGCYVDIYIAIDPVDYCIKYFLDTTLTIGQFVGIGDAILPEGIKVYPNPVFDVLNISATSGIQKVQVMNLMGEMILQQVEDRSVGNTRVDLSALQQGIYLVRLVSPDGADYVQRILVQ